MTKAKATREIAILMAAGEGRKTKPNSVYLFVIWNRGMPEAETRHNLKALTGDSLETFLSRSDLDGSITSLKFDAPLPYVEYPYAEENGKGPRFFHIFGLFSFVFCIGKVKVG